MPNVTEVIDQLADKAMADAANRRDAEADYPDILTRAADGQSHPEDGKRLARIVATLNLSAADVQSDLAAILAIREAEAGQAAAQERFASLVAEPSRLHDEADKLVADASRRERELRDAAHAALEQYRAAERERDNCIKRIGELRAGHPRLFPSPPEAGAAQPAPAPVNLVGNSIATVNGTMPEPSSNSPAYPGGIGHIPDFARATSEVSET